MRYIITILLVLFSYLSYGQKVGAQVLAFQGNVTSTVRDGLDVPTGEFWMIYNTTTSQIEVSDDTDTWTAFSGALQTAAQTTIADAGAIITATDVEGALQENRTAIDLNTAKATNATHTGEVTGSGALTIASGVVDSDNILDGTILVADLSATTLAAESHTVSGTPVNYSVTPGEEDVQGHLEGVDAALGAIAPGTNPFADGTALVKGSADATKLLRFEVDGLTTSTTRVITMKDENIDLNNMVESKTAGLGGAGQVLNVVFGVKDSIDTWSADANRLDICTDCPGTSLFEANQTIATGTTRLVNSAGTATLGFQQDGTELMRIGNNNDNAVYVVALEVLPGGLSTIGLTSPMAMPIRDITSEDATTNDNGIIVDTNNDSPYISNAAVWVPMAGNSRVVTSATISMTGNVMYDDQTADAATITLNDCNAGDELTVYINRASAPTLAGTGLTFNQLPNTTAFAGATEMGIFFQVAYNGTTVDYYYFER